MGSNYRVIVTREGNAWLAEVPDLPGVQTFTRDRAGLDAAVREAIALTEDLPEGAEASLTIAYDYQTSNSADRPTRPSGTPS